MPTATEYLQIFLTGFLDSVNFPKFFQRIQKQPRIFFYLFCYYLFLLVAFLPASIYLDKKWNYTTIQESKDKSFFLRLISHIPSALVSYLFAYLPWNITLLAVGSVFNTYLSKVIRKASVSINDIKQTVDETKAQVEKHPPLVAILTILKSAAPTIAIIVQNSILPLIPLVGIPLRFIVTCIYNGMLSFSPNFTLIPNESFGRQRLMPPSKQPLEVYTFCGKNWLYFAGFSAITKSILVILPTHPYARDILGRIWMAASIVMSFDITESLEVDLEQLNAPPRFSKDGLAPFNLPVAFLPTYIAMYITQACDFFISRLANVQGKKEEEDNKEEGKDTEDEPPAPEQSIEETPEQQKQQEPDPTSSTEHAPEQQTESEQKSE